MKRPITLAVDEKQFIILRNAIIEDLYLCRILENEEKGDLLQNLVNQLDAEAKHIFKQSQE